MKIILSILLLVGFSLMARDWILTNGVTATGDYVSSGTTTLVIKTHGTNCFLKISELSTNDQTYVAQMQLAQKQARLEAEAKQEQIAREHQAAIDAIVGIYESDGVARNEGVFGRHIDKIDLRSDGSAMLTPRAGREIPGNWTFANNSIEVSDTNHKYSETFTVERDDLIASDAVRWLHSP